MRPNRERVSFDLPGSIKQELVRMAHKYRITMTRYLLRIILERLRKELEWDADPRANIWKTPKKSAMRSTSRRRKTPPTAQGRRTAKQQTETTTEL